jgi:hypothetical protein
LILATLYFLSFCLVSTERRSDLGRGMGYGLLFVAHRNFQILSLIGQVDGCRNSLKPDMVSMAVGIGKTGIPRSGLGRGMGYWFVFSAHRKFTNKIKTNQFTFRIKISYIYRIRSS